MHATERITVEMPRIQLAGLLEDERRTAQPGDAPATVEPPPEPRPRKRTVRMRVFNFRPLTRPYTEEVTATPRSASTS